MPQCISPSSFSHRELLPKAPIKILSWLQGDSVGGCPHLGQAPGTGKYTPSLLRSEMRAGSSCSLCNSFIYPDTAVWCRVVGTQRCWMRGAEWAALSPPPSVGGKFMSPTPCFTPCH